MTIATLDQLKQLEADNKRRLDAMSKKVMVCCGTGCLANGAADIVESFQKTITDRNLKGISVETVRETGCHGFCQQGPLVIIEPQATFYTRVKTKDVATIVDQSLAGGTAVNSLLYSDPKTEEKIERYHDIGFFKHQSRIALRHLGRIAANDIRDYFAVGGYQAMARAVQTMTPDQIIDEIIKSGLRGRGGGGFPTGKKWRTCRNVPSDIRYVICNGDEGDPGAFMDRSIMEGDPHGVLEGMMICAFAVGANDGYIYVREEYPLAVVNLSLAMAQATEYGILGDNILGTGFSFRVHISRGAGAFVCGESSALMRSVAGEIGEPRAKYIHSVVKGLWDKPTVLNNVETFANVPIIFEKGADWYRGIGAPNNSGTKVFSLVGKVKNTGLIEVAMGTTMREIVYDIGGGIIDDRPFKGVQTGGPSGGCLPESMLDLPVDFDSLTKVGSMMGSGGMIVMDDKTCMVDVAKYFLSFLVNESCGKCVPCREGLYQLHRLACKISDGLGAEEDLATMERLSEMVILGSLCGLGKSGPNPLLSTIKYFRDEYLVHIREQRCPAAVCKALITYEVNEKCTGCLACITACAYNAITGKKKEMHLINQEACEKCGACTAVCKYDAITVS
jgi:NADH-quinone oxidoreductase subunit F